MHSVKSRATRASPRATKARQPNQRKAHATPRRAIATTRKTAIRQAAPHFAASRFMAATAPTAAMVKKLRDATGAPMIECKKALTAILGEPDFNADDNMALMKGASEWLRKRGAALADKNAGRSAKQGLVVLALNQARTKGALVELNCETDFVARNGTFMTYATRLALSMLATPQDEANNEFDVLKEVKFDGQLWNPAKVQNKTLAAGPSAMPSNPNAANNNIATELIDVITNCRENIKLRRIGVVEVPAGQQGFVTGYMHNEIPNAEEFQPFFNQINNDHGIFLRLGASGAAGAFVTEGEASPEATELGRKVMMQAVASAPEYLSRHNVPADVIQKEKEIMMAQTPVDGKPAHIVEKMLGGKLNKFYSTTCLLEQQYSLTNDDKPPTIEELLAQHSAKPKPVAVVKFLCGEIIPGEEEEEAAPAQ